MVGGCRVPLLEVNAGPAQVVTSLQSDGLACGGEATNAIGGNWPKCECIKFYRSSLLPYFLPAPL